MSSRQTTPSLSPSITHMSKGCRKSDLIQSYIEFTMRASPLITETFSINRSQTELWFSYSWHMLLFFVYLRKLIHVDISKFAAQWFDNL